VTTKSKANQSGGAPQHPSFGASTAHGTGSSGAVSGVYKSGQLQPANPQPTLDGRADFYRAFIRQLDMAVCKRAREEERLFQLGAVSPGMQSLLLAFHRSIVDTIESTTHHDEIGAPKTLSDARNLALEVEQFDRQVHAMIPTRQKQRRALLKCVEELIGDVRHYARQIELTYHSVPDEGGKPRLANRPTNLDAKQKFAELIFQHQQLNGPSAFPKTGQIRTALKASGIKVSDRTIRYWIAQMKNGTFDYFVQP
jgi:hypothetical protein